MKKKFVIFVEDFHLEEMRKRAKSADTSMAKLAAKAFVAAAYGRIKFFEKDLYVDGKLVESDGSELGTTPDQDIPEDTSGYPNITHGQYADIYENLSTRPHDAYKTDEDRRHFGREIAEGAKVNLDSVVRAMKKYPPGNDHPSYKFVKQHLKLSPPPSAAIVYPEADEEI